VWVVLFPVAISLGFWNENKITNHLDEPVKVLAIGACHERSASGKRILFRINKTKDAWWSFMPSTRPYELQPGESAYIRYDTDDFGLSEVWVKTASGPPQMLISKDNKKDIYFGHAEPIHIKASAFVPASKAVDEALDHAHARTWNKWKLRILALALLSSLLIIAGAAMRPHELDDLKPAQA
jgi:hypothetical protein